MTSTSFDQLDAVRGLLDRLLVEVGVPRGMVRDGDRISEDLELESIAFVELQVALEDELGIEIDPVMVVELDEVSAIARYLFALTLAR